MNSVTKSVTIFTCGALVASLPWLLSNRTTVAQDTTPAQGGLAATGQAPAGRGLPGQNPPGDGLVAVPYQGAPGAPAPGFGQGGGQFRPQAGFAPGAVMEFHGSFMYVMAGDVIYKISHRPNENEPMRVVSSLRLSQMTPPIGGGPVPRGGGAAGPRGGGD